MQVAGPTGIASERQVRLQALLDGLAREDKVLGVALIGKDGVRLIDAWGQPFWSRETFSAMSATLLGAAEVILSVPLGSRARKVTAEGDAARLAVVGVSEEAALAALADAAMPAARFEALTEAAAKDVAKVLLGG